MLCDSPFTGSLPSLSHFLTPGITSYYFAFTSRSQSLLLRILVMKGEERGCMRRLENR